MLRWSIEKAKIVERQFEHVHTVMVHVNVTSNVSAGVECLCHCVDCEVLSPELSLCVAKDFSQSVTGTSACIRLTRFSSSTSLCEHHDVLEYQHVQNVL